MGDTQYEDVLGDEPKAADQKQQTPADLRDALAKANKRAEAAEKRLVDRDVADRAATVTTFLKDKELPDEAKDLIGDQDPEEWYGTYSKLFGAKESDAASTAAAPETTAPVGASTLNAEQQAQIAAVAGVEALPFTPGNLEARDAYLDAATSEEDLLKRLAETDLLVK